MRRCKARCSAIVVWNFGYQDRGTLSRGSDLTATPDNRVACHYFQTKGGNGYVYITGGAADRNEVDNNVFDNHNSIAFNLIRCNPQIPSCGSNPIGTHIHHNTWKNKAPGGSGNEAIKLGSGYHEPDGATLYNIDGNNLDAIIENNLFDKWNGEAELISVKGDHNIIRNNCIKGSTISNIVIRTGSNNLVTGNWSDTVKEGIRISGRANYYVFNYRRAANGGQMFRLHPGELHSDGSRYAYTDASRSVLRYNVSSSMNRMRLNAMLLWLSKTLLSTSLRSAAPPVM